VLQLPDAGSSCNADKQANGPASLLLLLLLPFAVLLLLPPPAARTCPAAAGSTPTAIHSSWKAASL
jgi:hypothetical protein